MTLSTGSNERQIFETFFHENILPDVLGFMKEYHLPEDGFNYFHKMILHTVPGGKNNRGLTVLSSLKSLLKTPPTEQQIFNAQLLGWCVEILQAYFLVADDICDSSETRRGLPCWYKMPNVGLIAINDALILEALIYKLIRKHLKNQPYYVNVIELFHEVSLQTEVGQLMDLITAPQDKADLTKFNLEKYAYIVRYKTAYYSFYLPVALAMFMAGITSEEAHKQALDILLPLGEYFQVQDDYLDCFADPEVLGKIGTDIHDNKCSWLVNQALKLASPAQLNVLNTHYGQKGPKAEEAVKQVYRELQLEKLYHEFEEESYVRIGKMIDELQGLPKDMFFEFMHRIYKRQK